MFQHSLKFRFSSVKSIIGRTISVQSSFDTETFVHPPLSYEESQFGTKLGLDTWADTGCSGKHAFVEEFIEGRTVTATGFTSSLGSMNGLPLANVLYAYDSDDGEVFILEHNNTIYLGDKLIDSLANPLQSELHGVRIDLRPQEFYPRDDRAQSIEFPDGTTIPIIFDGILPYIPVRRPTPDEVANCRRISLTSTDEWNPHDVNLMCSGLQSRKNLLPPCPVGEDPQIYYNLSMLVTTPMLESHNDGQYYHAIHSNKSATITPEELARMWKIGLKTAARTLNATTHQCIRTTGMLARRYRTDMAQLRYKQLSRIYGTFYCDYLKSHVKSIRGYIGGTLYTNKHGFLKFFPAETEASEETGRSLRSFIDIVGLPYGIHSDNHKNFKEGLFKKIMRKFGIKASYTEPHSPWQNRAESAIGEVKKYARRLMQETNTPVRLWCFCYEYSADVLSLCATGRYELKGRTAYECVMNSTPDISEYATFEWFQWCWYFDEGTKSKRLCRWLGPSHGIGQAFCSFILLDNAEYIARSSVLPIPLADLKSDYLVQQTNEFMRSINARIGNSRQALYDATDPHSIYYSNFSDDPVDDTNALPYGDEILEVKLAEADDSYIDTLDSFIGLQVVVKDQLNDQPVLAKIKRRKRDHSGNPIGEQNPNPILDSRIYELEYPDGRIEEFSVNTIVENMVQQVDDQGFDTGILNEIIDFRRDPLVAVSISDIPPGETIITTKGWDIKVSWKDGSTDWLPLVSVKESNPIELAEFAFANKLQDEPAFKWWVKKVLKKRDHIIKKLKSRMVRKPGNMKFGMRVPSSINEAIEIDRENGNTMWQDAIAKEMNNAKVAFKLLNRDENPPPGSKEITCHLVFDIKLDGTRKARYVAGGHLTDPPSSMTYASVVSRESVRLAFLIAALNDLDILAGDIQNAYLNAETKEKVHFFAGPEWKCDEGRCIVIVRALYGLKSSALAWRNHISDVIGNQMGFKSSLADPDVWMKPRTHSDGFQYYAYILVYVDDVLIIDKNPGEFMEMLKSAYTVKPSSIGTPDRYLGADVKKVQLSDGSYAWTMSPQTYVKNAVKSVKDRLKKDGFEYNRKLSDVRYSPKQPFTHSSYKPELDVSAECSDDQVSYFQQLIGVLRWIVELGRIDIAYEVSILSSYLASPRTGHLLQAIHIFKYLEIHNSYSLSFGTAYHHVLAESEIEAMVSAMKLIYVDAQEDLPHNAPEPRGLPLQVNCFVDSDHAGNRVTRRSHTGILIFCNNAPITWYSKKQSTIESSTYGSEFVALKIASELITSLRYKLRMFGIPIDGPANVFCDNESVYKNASIAESQLRRKHNSICFHKVRESVAANIMIPHKVDSKENLADLLTKSLSWSSKAHLLYNIMFTAEESKQRDIKIREDNVIQLG